MMDFFNLNWLLSLSGIFASASVVLKWFDSGKEKARRSASNAVGASLELKEIDVVVKENSFLSLPPIEFRSGYLPRRVWRETPKAPLRFRVYVYIPHLATMDRSFWKYLFWPLLAEVMFIYRNGNTLFAQSYGFSPGMMPFLIELYADGVRGESDYRNEDPDEDSMWDSFTAMSVDHTYGEHGKKESRIRKEPKFYRIPDIILKESTENYLRGTVGHWSNYHTLYARQTAGNPMRMGMLLYGEKGTGKSEMSKCLGNTVGGILRVASVSNITELIQVLEHQELGPSVDYDRSISTAVENPVYRLGHFRGEWEYARKRGYTGTLEEFVALPKANIGTVITYVIDDLDRIDFSEVSLIPRLLSVIDELGRTSPVLLIATANDYEKIPDVIRRAGRFTVNVKFDLVDEEIANRYIDRSWPQATLEQRELITGMILGEPMSWPTSLVTKEQDPDHVIEFLREAKHQNWRFTQ